jgi:translocation and assembly module TamB
VSRRIVVLGALLALLLAALAAGLLGWRLLTAESGRDFLLEQLRRIPGVTIETTGAGGTVASALSFERLVVDHEAVRIEAAGVKLEPRLRQILWQTLTLRDVSVASLKVQLKPQPEAPPEEVHFLPRFLRIAVRDFAVRDFTLVLADGRSYHVDLLSGSALATRWTIDLPGVAIEDPAGRIDASVRLRAGLPLRLRGEARGHWQLPDERDYRFTLQARGDLERLATTLELSAPAVLRFDGNALALQESPRLVGTLRLTDFDGSPWAAPGVLPKVAGSIAVDASERGIGLDGTLTAAGFGAEPLRLQGAGSYADQRIEIAGLQAWLPQSGLTLRTAGTIELGGERPVLTLGGDFEKFRWPLTGEPAVRAEVGEYTLAGDLPYAVTLDSLVEIPQLPQPVRARGAATLDADGLRLDRLDAELLRGTLRGSGTLAWSGEQRWAFTVDGKGLDLTELRKDLPGRIDVLGRIEGQGLTADAPWTAKLERVSGSLLGRSLTARGAVRHLGAGGYELQGLQLANADTRIAVDGRVGERFDLRWDAAIGSLRLLLPGLDGRLHSSGTLRGTAAAPLLAASGAATGIRYAGVEVESLDYDVDVDLGDARESRIDVGARGIRSGDLEVQFASLIGRGRSSDHRLDLRLRSPGKPEARVVPFIASLGLVGAYRHADTSWRGQLENALLDYDTGDARLLQPAGIALSPRAAQLEPTCFASGEARLCAEGDWQATPQRWQLLYSAQDWPLRNLLNSLAGRRDIDGRVQASGWALQEPGKRWVGSSVILIDEPVVEIARNKFRSDRVQLGSARLDIYAAEDAFRSTLDLQVAESTRLTGEVRADRVGELAEHPLSGRLHAESTVLSALPLLVPEIDRAGGRLDGDLSVGGTLGAPQFNGQFAVRDGVFELYRTNLALSAVTVDGRFTGDVFDIEARGQTRKGALELSGRFSWPDGVMQGEMHLKGEDVLVADTPEYRVLASPNLRFRAANGGFEVDGEILIPTARIALRDLSTTIATSPDERIVGIDPRAAPLAENGDPATAPTAATEVRAQVLVRLGDQVRIDSYGLRARLGGEVEVRLRPGDVARGTGEIKVIEGNYKAFGQDVKITRGRLIFRDSPLGEPTIEVTGERVFEDEDITVTVSIRGELSEPYLTLSSTPAMTQSEALSYLLTGRSLDTLQSGEATSVNAAAESLAVSGGGLLLGQVGRRIGLDEVSVERTDTDDTAVVLGKFLSPRLFVSYGVSIAEAINTVKLRYTLNERWSLRAEAGLEQSADVEFKIER